MPHTRRLAALVALPIAMTTLLAGCMLPAPEPPPSGPRVLSEPVWAPTGEAVAPGLERFYAQEVDWQGCGDNWCGRIQAPMDWFGDSDETIELSVVVAPAQKERKGAILYNPGGPGASGAEYVTNYGKYLMRPEVRENYDLVGFDPRGVGGSTPISCYDDPKELYDWLWDVPAGPAPDPLSDEALAEQVADAEWLGKSCLENTGPLLEFVGTEQVASDMDLMRALLGEEKLNYLGVSYGTLIGSIYADLFPENVGRFVLDAASSPAATEAEGTLYQAAGFEKAYGNFVADCLDGDECPFQASTSEAALAETKALLDSLDAKPLQAKDGRRLASGALFTAIASNLYSDAQWEGLREILQSTIAGDPEPAFAAADEYYSVEPDGTFADNSLEALIAVNCLDQPPVTDWKIVRENAAEIQAAAPTLGANFVGLSSCAAWPFAATREPAAVEAPGADPIIVIGGLNDPATPYDQSVELAEMLESGVLISVDAEGHSQYGKYNECVDRPVNEYFTTGVAPPGPLNC